VPENAMATQAVTDWKKEWRPCTTAAAPVLAPDLFNSEQDIERLVDVVCDWRD